MFAELLNVARLIICRVKVTTRDSRPFSLENASIRECSYRFKQPTGITAVPVFEFFLFIYLNSFERIHMVYLYQTQFIRNCIIYTCIRMHILNAAGSCDQLCI